MQGPRSDLSCAAETFAGMASGVVGGNSSQGDFGADVSSEAAEVFSRERVHAMPGRESVQVGEEVFVVAVGYANHGVGRVYSVGGGWNSARTESAVRGGLTSAENGGGWVGAVAAVGGKVLLLTE